MTDCIDIRQLKGKIKDDAQSVVIKTGDKKQTVILEYQKVGYGQKRFFVCPVCSKRVEQLYPTKTIWKCRKCSGVLPYQGIQNNTKGGYEEIAYRMKRYAKKQEIDFTFPFDYTQFALDKRNRKPKFRENLKILQALENMRFQCIFQKVRFQNKTIRAVLSGKHILLQVTTLQDLQNNVYDWNI